MGGPGKRQEGRGREKPSFFFLGLLLPLAAVIGSWILDRFQLQQASSQALAPVLCWGVRTSPLLLSAGDQGSDSGSGGSMCSWEAFHLQVALSCLLFLQLWQLPMVNSL